jgi:YVTN family beta-propeller protein
VSGRLARLSCGVACVAGIAFGGVLVGAAPAAPLPPGTTSTLAVGTHPDAVSTDGTDVWVANYGSNNVTELDATTGAAVATLAVGTHPDAISSDGTDVWVANAGSNNVTELDATTDVVVATISVGTAPAAISSDGVDVWVANSGSNNVTELNATTGAVIATISVGTDPDGISSDGSNTWVTNYTDGTVSMIDNSTSSVVDTVSVGTRPDAVSSDGVDVWVANYGDNTVTELDATDGSLVTTTAVGNGPDGISSDGLNVYVANGADNTLSQLDTTDGSLVRTIGVGSGPVAVSAEADDSNVWVANYYDDTVTELAPAVAPSTPTAVGATPGVHRITVHWTPAFNGGSAVTAYTATTGTYSCTTTVMTFCVIWAVPNGTTFSVTVTATNAIGTSAASSPVSVTTPTVPGAPTGVTATRGNARVTIHWTPPTSNGGSAIRGYTASDGSGHQCVAAPPRTSCIVNRLTNGTTYTFTVTANNAVGASSGTSTGAVTPATRPSVPTGLSATRGNGQETLNWTAPVSNGGSAITVYTVSTIKHPGLGCTTSSGTSCTVTGLTNGGNYRFVVTATNSVGISKKSRSALGTPSTTPGTPTISSAVPGTAQVTVHWGAVSTGGAPVTYTVSDGVGGTCSTHLTACTVTGLTSGTLYSFTVTAANVAGSGSPSAPVSARPN